MRPPCMSFAVIMKGPSGVVGMGLVKPYVIRDTKVLRGATHQWTGTSPISALLVPLLLLPAIHELLQVRHNGDIQTCGFLLLPAQRCGKSVHLLLKRLTIVFDRLSPHVAPGC